VTLGCKDIGIRSSDFVARTVFLLDFLSCNLNCTVYYKIQILSLLDFLIFGHFLKSRIVGHKKEAFITKKEVCSTKKRSVAQKQREICHE